MTTTTDLKQALLNVDGTTLKVSGRKWKLDCAVRNGRFNCDAQNLTPRDEMEAKFCITDLWKSDSDESAKIMVAFAVTGGFVAGK